MSRESPRAKRSMGFTIAELLIVILVLAIMAAVVIPNIGSAADTQLASAARVLTTDLETTRTLALTTQAPHTLVFSTDIQSYKVARDYAGGAYAATVAIDHPVRAQTKYEVALRALNGMDQVVVNEVKFGTGPYVTYATFNADGTATAPGHVYLMAGNSYMTISVEALTGNITVAGGKN